MPTAQAPEPSGKVPARYRAALLAAGLAVALPGLFMGLHADDWFQVRPRGAAEILSTFAGDWGSGARGLGGFYRPLVRLSFYIDGFLYGLAPAGYHLTNGLIFLAILAGLQQAASYLAPGRAMLSAIAIAVVFALHPLRSEALYWVSGRTDLLATAGVAWSVALALSALSRGCVARAVGSLGFLVLGLLSKEVALAGAAIVPLVALMLAARRGDAGHGQDAHATARWLLVAGPVVLGVGYLVFRSSVLGGIGAYATGAEPIRVEALGRNFATMVSSLSTVTGLSRDTFPLAGCWRTLAMAAAFLLIGKFRRAPVAMMAATLLAMLPMATLSISPLDGTRVMLMPMAFMALFIVSAAVWAHRITARLLIAMGVLLAIAASPANIGFAWQFVAAKDDTADSVDAAMDEFRAAPDGAVFVYPATQSPWTYRILTPGDAMSMAVLAHALQATGSTWRDASDPAIPRIGIEVTEPGRTVFLSVALQPWMESPVIFRGAGDSRQYFRMGGVETRKPARGESIVLARDDAIQWSVEAVEDGPGAVTLRGEGGLVLPGDGYRVRWIDAANPATLALPGDVSFQLRSLRVAGYLEARLE